MTDKKKNPFMSSMIVFSSSDIMDKTEKELKADALAQLKMKKQRKND